MAEPAGHASLGPFRTVELALSADLASAVGDADVFARALDALSKIAPQGLAADLRAVADLATRDLRGAQARWSAVREQLDGMVTRRRAAMRRGDVG